MTVGLLTRFPAGAEHSEIYVVVDVRVRGGAVGLQAISLRATDETELFVSPADGGMIPEGGGLTEMVNGTGERRILEEGAFVSWVYRVSSPLEGDGVDADTEIVAEVALTSGKVVRSKPITVPPDSVTA